MVDSNHLITRFCRFSPYSSSVWHNGAEDRSNTCIPSEEIQHIRDNAPTVPMILPYSRPVVVYVCAQCARHWRCRPLCVAPPVPWLRWPRSRRRPAICRYLRDHSLAVRMKGSRIVGSLRDDDNRAVVPPLPPPLNHIHEFDQRVSTGRHFVFLWPTCDLKQLSGLWLGFDAGHQLLERNNFLVDPKDPWLDVRVVVVRDEFDGEDGAILFLFDLFVRPKRRICLSKRPMFGSE